MRNKFSGIRGALGVLTVYTSSILAGCTSPQVVAQMPNPVQTQPQNIERRPEPRRYNFESASSYGHMNLSYTESVNGSSRSVDIEMYDTDGDGRTAEQAIVTRRQGYNTQTFMFVRPGAKIARQPTSRDDVRMMTSENEQMFDKFYGGESDE